MVAVADARIINVEEALVRIVVVKGYGLQSGQKFSAILKVGGTITFVDGFARPDGRFEARFVVDAEVQGKMIGVVTAGTTTLPFGAAALQ